MLCDHLSSEEYRQQELQQCVPSPHLTFRRYVRAGTSLCGFNSDQAKSGGYQDGYFLTQTCTRVEEAACACAQRHGRSDELIILTCDHTPRPQHVQQVVESSLCHEVHDGLTSLLQEPTAGPARGHGTRGYREKNRPDQIREELTLRTRVIWASPNILNTLMFQIH